MKCRVEGMRLRSKDERRERKRVKGRLVGKGGGGYKG